MFSMCGVIFYARLTTVKLSQYFIPMLCGPSKFGITEHHVTILLPNQVLLKQTGMFSIVFLKNPLFKLFKGT